MTNRHRDAVIHVIQIAKLLHLWVPDLKDIIEEGRRADEIGPFVDPTAWIAKGEHLREDPALLRLALPLVQYAAQHMPKDEDA